jgi:hypothetical protein
VNLGSILGDSFAYAKDAVVGKWMQWLLLIIATVLLFIPLMGYSVRVFRGDRPAPLVTDWIGLFLDGIKYLVITLIYAIPSLVILAVTFGSAIIALASGETDLLVSGVEGLFFGLAIFMVVAIICGLFGMIGVIRFARTGSIGEAFNFVSIRETIGKIGWVSYILAFIVMFIVQVGIAFIFGLITAMPVVGLIIEFILIAPITIFEARYFALVYEQGDASL